MTCIKTGCYAYIEPYNQWIYGDAHLFGSSYVFRIVESKWRPYPVRHFTILNFGEWWDKGKDVSTLISNDVVRFGYEGTAEIKRDE